MMLYLMRYDSSGCWLSGKTVQSCSVRGLTSKIQFCLNKNILMHINYYFVDAYFHGVSLRVLRWTLEWVGEWRIERCRGIDWKKRTRVVLPRGEVCLLFLSYALLSLSYKEALVHRMPSHLRNCHHQYQQCGNENFWVGFGAVRFECGPGN
jgi:hypothetical protein